MATPLLPLPAPRVTMTIRAATLADVPAMDALQKRHGRQLGFFPRAQMEGYVRAGNVLVAEATADVRGSEFVVRGEDPLRTSNHEPRTLPSLLGYVAYRDRYLKRDELGVIYQLCVAEAGRRKLVGARLIQEVFTRSPYGCRLYCCWCAQDIAANRFWEALGFVPLAFRSGGRVRGSKFEVRGEEPRRTTNHKPRTSARVHIFWQKRIKLGDVTTPWWYPSETGGGAIKENRLVLPIPPGVRWCDEMPIILPTAGEQTAEGGEPSAAKALTGPRRKMKTAEAKPVEVKAAGVSALGRPAFAAREPAVAKPVETTQVEKKPKEKRASHKNDPALVARARELRDRWMEQVNEENVVALPTGKYEIARIEAGDATRLEETRLQANKFIDVERTKTLAA